ncbi:hypothetical protein ACHWQZ_G009987 [Mnemiopsis leidyi]
MIKKSETDSSGTVVEVSYLRKIETISDECLEEVPFHPSLAEDLNKLPYPITRPHETWHWVAYQAFLHKWGSQILKSTTSGAKAVLHTKTTKKSSTDKSELTAKLCAKFPDINIDGCADTGPNQSTLKDKSDESSEVFVHGGTIRTQDKLRAGHFTPEVLDQLAEEAADHQEPIKHEWYSLPELILVRAMFEAGAKEGELQRALALVSYYKGYHLFGCHHQVIEGQNVTVFANVGDDNMPVFKCFQLRPGCIKHSDCVNWPIKYVSPCYCAGKSCMEVKRQGIKGKRSTELSRRYLPGGVLGDLTNFSCKWNSQHGCLCDVGELEEVWPQGLALTRGMARDMKVYWILGFIGVGVVVIVVWLACRKTPISPVDSARQKVE